MKISLIKMNKRNKRRKIRAMKVIDKMKKNQCYPKTQNKSLRTAIVKMDGRQKIIVVKT